MDEILSKAPGRRLLRVVRRSLAITCFVAFAAFIILGIRSWTWIDTIYQHGQRTRHLRSWDGRIEFRTSQSRDLAGKPMYLSSMPLHEFRAMQNAMLKATPGGWLASESPFAWETDRPGRLTVRLPHWFLALTTLVLAVGMKPAPRWRFSIADALVAMTLAALLAAAVAAVSRLPGMGG